MKMSKFQWFFAVILVSVIVFAGCSKNSNNPVDPGNNILTSEAKLTLNGAGYTNKAVTLSNGISAYSLSDTVTAIQFSGKADSDSLYFLIVLKGNQTGTVNWNDDNGVILIKNSSSAYIGATQGTTTVSSYGAVNGKVEGTISGKLIEQSSQAELNITGSFSAVRIPDIN
jgi:hypothetical protein